jgi:hypothetical protein
VGRAALALVAIFILLFFIRLALYRRFRKR